MTWMWDIPFILVYSTIAGVIGGVIGEEHDNDSAWLGWVWPLVLVYWTLLAVWDGGYWLGSLPRQARKRAEVEARAQALHAQQARKAAKALEEAMGRRPDGTYPDPIPDCDLRLPPAVPFEEFRAEMERHNAELRAMGHGC